jgi:mRNA (2'-O-methyladenosine-N6-)-methyltransferase
VLSFNQTKYLIKIQYIVYRLVDTIVWVKKGKTAEFRSNQGYHVRHAKEIALLGLKGNSPKGASLRKVVDVINSMPRMHSQKPDEQYRIGELLCPHGLRVELFARRHNMRPGWISIGNEISEEAYAEALRK